MNADWTTNDNTPGARSSIRGRFLTLMQALLIALVWLLSHDLHAQSTSDIPGQRLYIADSENEALNQRLRSLLADAFGGDVAIRSVSNPQETTDTGSPIIAIGPRAFQDVLVEFPDTPVLGLFVDDTYVTSARAQADGLVSSVLSEPPLARQVAIGKAILPHATRISMLARPNSEHLYTGILDELHSFGMEGRLFIVPSPDRLIPTLIQALNYGDFILAAPDNTIYNPRTIKHILLTAYRRNRIIIGPSQAYVKAGALASSFTPLSEIAKTSARYIQSYWKTGQMAVPTHPMEFGIDVNRQVGRSLNIPIPERDILLKAVQERLRLREEGQDE